MSSDSVLVDDPTRVVLETALRLKTPIVALRIENHMRIFSALGDSHTRALTEPRAVLLSKHEWRFRKRLVTLAESSLLWYGS